MTNSGNANPRRAFGPIGDDSDEDVTKPREYLPTRAMVRADPPITLPNWTSTEGADGSGNLEPSTPIPPPAPVLPEPEAGLPASAGRRFSAAPPDEDYVSGVPRRSAVSVSSPPERWQLATADAPAAAATAGTNGDPEVKADTAGVEPEDPAESAVPVIPPSRRKLLVAVLVGILAVALIVAVAIWMTLMRPTTSATPPGASPSASSVSDLAMLLGPSDIGKLRRNTTWSVLSPTASPDATGRELRCLPGTAGQPVPQGVQSQVLTGSADAARLLHVQELYADDTAAEKAFNDRLAQLGGCLGTEGYLTAGYAISGLSDRAVAVELAVQETRTTTHSIVMAQTGRFINVIDQSQTRAAVPMAELAAVIAKSLDRQCAAANGQCPGTIRTTAGAPPASGLPGWLVEADLPRITPGAGTWGATTPDAPNLKGSVCEMVNLSKLPGATDQVQRTYLLTNDPTAPQAFGLDEVLYEFPDARRADGMAKQIVKNINDCGPRDKTASVAAGSVTVRGGGGKDVKASTFAITQKVTSKQSVKYRVAVTSVGERLVYLLANPGSSFDFSDAEWSAVVQRAVQRITQLP